MRCGGKLRERVGRARKVYERYVIAHADLDSYMKWAGFEEKHGDVCILKTEYNLKNYPSLLGSKSS